jgi:hypothetical protein
MAYVIKKDVTFVSSEAIAGCCNAIFELKSALTGAGWTVKASGTGVNSASYSANSDLILSASQLNTARAWFRIQMPSSNREWTFQRSETVGAGNDVSWRIKVAPGGFNGVTPAGVIATGSYNSTPAGSTENVVLGTGTDASPTAALYFVTTNAPTRAQIIVNNASPYDATMVSYVAGSGAKQCMWFTDAMLAGTYGANDTDPYVYGVHANTTNAGLAAIFSVEGTYQTAIITGSIPSGYIVAAVYNVGGNVVIPGGLSTNPYTGQDEVFALTWMRRALASTVNYSNPVSGQKGVSSLFLWCGTTRAVGSAYSLATTNDRFIYGHVAIPWDGTIPNV